MNKITSILLGGTLMAAFTLPSFGAGPLTPPGTPGQPVADMPSLVEIKAAIDALQTGVTALSAVTGTGLNGRTAIPVQTATYTIDTSGNYVLTGNITVSTGNGINITASDVTLDLNGFTISSTSSPKSDTAVYVVSTVNSLSFKNGHITSESTSGFINGLMLERDSQGLGGMVFEDLVFRNLGIDSLGVSLVATGSYPVVLKGIVIHEGAMNLFGLEAGNPFSTGIRFGTAIECLVNSPSPSLGIRVNHAIHCTAPGSNVNANLEVGCLPAP